MRRDRPDTVLTTLVLTDGSGNEERTPDVRYEWKPSA
jgi:hypothetical protein